MGPHPNDAGQTAPHAAAVATNKGHSQVSKVALRVDLCEMGLLTAVHSKGAQSLTGWVATRGRPLGRPSSYRQLSACRLRVIFSKAAFLPSAVVFDSRDTLMPFHGSQVKGTCNSNRERVLDNSYFTRLEALNYERICSDGPSRSQPIIP